MRIVDQQHGIRRPVLCEHRGIVKLTDHRRHFLIFFYGLFALLMALGMFFCICLSGRDGEALIVGVMYFGFVGGVMGYITLRIVARSHACWFYPQERLVQFRTTWFGLCIRRRWFDLAHAVLILEPARLRGTQTTRNPLAWAAFIALIPLGVLGLLLGVEMEKNVLRPAQAISVKHPQGHIEVIVVVAEKEAVGQRVLALFEQVPTGE